MNDRKTRSKDQRRTSYTPNPRRSSNKKINGKTFVTEIYFERNSKDTFQDKLLKIVQSERRE